MREPCTCTLHPGLRIVTIWLASSRVPSGPPGLRRPAAVAGKDPVATHPRRGGDLRNDTKSANDLHVIFQRCNTDSVDIDWPADFGRWLDRLEEEARAGDERSRLLLGFTARALDQLRNLTDPPAIETETATLRQVRQSRRYELWRVSHAYHPQVAVRLICWFPPGSGTVVVALFATDKAKMGDVFYDGVAARADPMIDQWKRETSYEEKP
jgi:hypothetical protein